MNKLAVLIFMLVLPLPCRSQETDGLELKEVARPAIKSNRWQEYWSPLADPVLRTQPLDSLKYIPFAPSTYMSLGLQVRERMDSADQPAFGIGRQSDAYLLQRVLLHADIRIADHWQVFSQIEDARAFNKKVIGPSDQNRLDLRMAFVAFNAPWQRGDLKLRIGRQEFAFDLQRFVSLRDGPNVRQSFDAAWANYETENWRVIAFLSHPVQYRDDHPFDDHSSRKFSFHTFRIERHVLGSNELSAYYSRYALDGSEYLNAPGDERRNILDIRFAGTRNSIDWDLEAMGQRGGVGTTKVRAWAFGGRAGYTFDRATLSPRVGIQLDVASGDRNPADGVLQTFNPLFPNGSYFTLAGYTGYVNVIHVKPALILSPTENLKIAGAVGLLWRQTTSDAVYLQPDIPVAGTAAAGRHWTGRYIQIRGDYRIDNHLQGAIELVHYSVGSALQRAGGSDSSYVGAELKFTW